MSLGWHIALTIGLIAAGVALAAWWMGWAAPYDKDMGLDAEERDSEH